jgi:hypothetical protein
MEALIDALVGQLTINTKLVNKSIDDLGVDAEKKRVNGKANSPAYILAHLTSARYFMAGLVGVKEEFTLEGRFADSEKDADPAKYPSLAELKESYNEITSKLIEGMKGASVENLQKVVDFPFPETDRTVIGGLTFLTQHDAYHTGQLGYIGAINEIEGPYSQYRKS